MNVLDPFHLMCKPRGAICNLDCAYCYFLKKAQLYPMSDFRMSDEVLESYTRQFIQAQSGPEVIFAWQGGEPLLMGLDFYRQALELQERYARPETRIQNTIQTNGTLIDEGWCQLFKEHDFLVGISIDGPAELHDVYRVDKGGTATLEKVLAGLDLLKAWQVPYNILTTVNAANANHPERVYRFLRDELEAEYIQFIPIVERENKKGEQRGNRISSHSVSAEQYGEFLCRVFDEWVRRDVGSVFMQIFEVALGKWLGLPGGLCVFDETCGSALALEHNGDLYACDHYVEPRYRLGNILKTDLAQLVVSHKQVKFGQAKQATLPRYCLECEVRFACNGGCPKDRVRHTPEGEYGLNYLCGGYQRFFKHIDRPMRVMADLVRRGLPAEGVMVDMDRYAAT